MASRSSVYDVQQDHYAFSLNGELVSRGVSPCVIAIVIFDDDTVMMEHRSDPDLYNKVDEDNVIKLYESITSHIIDCKGEQAIIRDAYLIGGCEDEIKENFQKLLVELTPEIINDEALSELENGTMINKLATAMKIINLTWNIKQEESFGLNEPYFDIGIIYHYDAGLCFILKQCFNIKNDKTSSNISVCCGALSYKLKTNSSTFLDGEYYNKKKVSASLKVEKDIMIYNKCVERFLINAASLGAKQIEEDEISFTAALEQDMVNRVTVKIPEGVVVKKI